LKCEALALKTSGLGLVLLGLDTVGLVNITGRRASWTTGTDRGIKVKNTLNMCYLIRILRDSNC